MMAPLRMLPALAIALVTSLPTYADCVLPPAPSRIPDGSKASEQEMMTAMQTMKEYSADVDTYMKCLDFEARQKHVSRDQADKLHDTAVDTLQKLATKFNEQVRTFKSRSS
jgi:hypothetical protein